MRCDRCQVKADILNFSATVFNVICVSRKAFGILLQNEVANPAFAVQLAMVPYVIRSLGSVLAVTESKD